MNNAHEGRVLVTGAGGAAGVAVIRALRGRYDVLAVDCDPDAVGLRLAGRSGVVPRGDSPDFAAHVAKLASRHGATALVCTVAEEIEALRDGAGLLAEAGLRSWLPSVSAVRTCTDKWAFAQACARGRDPGPGDRAGHGRRRAGAVDRQAPVRPRLARRVPGRHTRPMPPSRCPGWSSRWCRPGWTGASSPSTRWSTATAGWPARCRAGGWRPRPGSAPGAAPSTAARWSRRWPSC